MATDPRPRILVVDDDAAILDFVTSVLVEEGYDVRTAPHGRAAEPLAAGWHPALILLDLHMPVADGWDFMLYFEAQDEPRPPVIVFSAARDADRAAQALGAAACLHKPFMLDELLALVQSHVGPVAA